MSGTSGAPEGRVAITVGALGLPTVTDAAYTIEVYNGDPDAGGELIISRENLLSSRFGDGGGALSYVAPCDAQAGSATVRLTLHALYEGDGVLVAPDTWQNPTPISLSVACVENADTPVTFNLTVMRDARQGFFDIGVTFSNIFCSAKFDCLGDDGDPIALLHDPATGERDTTLVLAFACTAGPEKETWLHMSDVYVACDNGGSTTPYWISPFGTMGGLAGNQGSVAPVFFQTGLYRGREALPDVDKCYWNLAFGLGDDAPANCRLIVDATASDASFAANGGSPPEGATYPLVHFEVPFTDAEGQLACGRHAINDTSGRVATRYTSAVTGRFPSEWTCNDPASTPAGLGRVQCSEDVQGHGPTAATWTQTPSGVSVAFGASRSEAYTLPAGLELEGCCVSPCCSQ